MENFELRVYSMNEIYNYNNQIVPNLDTKSLLETLNYNKSDIQLTIREFIRSNQQINININEIRKNLKRKSKKFIISREYNEGNLYSIGADIEFKPGTYNYVVLPIGPNKDKPLASMSFRYWKRNKNLKNKFNQLITALRSNKISFEYSIIKEKNLNKLKLDVIDPRDNERFWYTVRLWSKH